MSNRATEGAISQAIVLATGIQNLRGSNPQGDNDVLFAGMVPNPTRSIFVNATNTCPAWYFITNSTDGVLCVDGTSTLVQAQAIARGYIGGLLDSRTDPVNAFFQNAGAEIIGGLITRGTRFPLGMTLAGHSLGGATVHYAIVNANVQMQWGVSSYTHTFGAPRPGGPTFRNTVQGQGGIIRWFNDDDAVPIVPPRVENFPAILPVFGVAGCIRAANFVHCDGGLEIGLAGSLTDAVVPSHANANFTADLVAWLMTWLNDEVPSHSLTEYLRRLRAAQVVIAPHARPTLGHEEQPVAASSHRITAQERRTAQAFAELESTQNSMPMQIPDQFQFRAVRIGRIWTLTFADQTVSVCGGRRQARAIARTANAWLKKLQRAAVVDTNAIVQAFQNYVAAASSDSGGFSPIMQDEFPIE